MYNIVNDRGREWGSCCGELLSPSVRKVRIEIALVGERDIAAVSPSVRKVRIEILIHSNKFTTFPVTFCEEGAD